MQHQMDNSLWGLLFFLSHSVFEERYAVDMLLFPHVLLLPGTQDDFLFGIDRMNKQEQWFSEGSDDRKNIISLFFFLWSMIEQKCLSV